MLRKIGILGGTFDPPHIGHLVIAEEAMDELALEEVWFIPSFEPPHKDNAHTGSTFRQEMLKLAIQDNSCFKIDTIELERLGKSYTIDTIQTLTDRYPDTHFHFIIGADMVEYLPHWKAIDDLMELITFVGVKRAGHRLDTPYPLEEIDIPRLDISSSMLRERLSRGASIRYLVPGPVEDFIREYRLYGHAKS